MRAFILLTALTGLLSLSACGGCDEQRTVVVHPSASGQTVVVPPEGDVRTCPPGQTNC
jgi:hypothetical protein